MEVIEDPERNSHTHSHHIFNASSNSYWKEKRSFATSKLVNFARTCKEAVSIIHEIYLKGKY